MGRRIACRASRSVLDVDLSSVLRYRFKRRAEREGRTGWKEVHKIRQTMPERDSVRQEDSTAPPQTRAGRRCSVTADKRGNPHRPRLRWPPGGPCPRHAWQHQRPATREDRPPARGSGYGDPHRRHGPGARVRAGAPHFASDGRYLEDETPCIELNRGPEGRGARSPRPSHPAAYRLACAARICQPIYRGRSSPLGKKRCHQLSDPLSTYPIDSGLCSGSPSCW